MTNEFLILIIAIFLLIITFIAFIIYKDITARQISKEFNSVDSSLLVLDKVKEELLDSWKSLKQEISLKEELQIKKMEGSFSILSKKMEEKIATKFKVFEDSFINKKLEKQPLPVEDDVISIQPPSLSIEESLLLINKLIGMHQLKDEINLFIDVLNVNKIRKDLGKKSIDQSLHSVFYGPPGTGKTSVARILGSIYKSAGILSSGHIVEVSRSDLVSQYIGKTAIITNYKIDEAQGGILFIDEAYSLFSESGSDYGSEAVNTLIKRMEDDRSNFVVILAGYKKEMDSFLKSNTGFKSRFTHLFTFENYTIDELVMIYESFFTDQGFYLTDNALSRLKSLFEVEIKKDPDTFGNGRFARNLFESSLRSQSRRLLELSELKTITIDDLEKIEEEDITIKFTFS